MSVSRQTRTHDLGPRVVLRSRMSFQEYYPYNIQAVFPANVPQPKNRLITKRVGLGQKGQKVQWSRTQAKLHIFPATTVHAIRMLATCQSFSSIHTSVLQPSWILSGTIRVGRHQKGKAKKVKPMCIYCRKRQ